MSHSIEIVGDKEWWTYAKVFGVEHLPNVGDTVNFVYRTTWESEDGTAKKNIAIKSAGQVVRIEHDYAPEDVTYNSNEGVIYIVIDESEVEKDITQNFDFLNNKHAKKLQIDELAK